MQKKKKILAVWWYDRDDLLDVFMRIADEFELTFLFYKFKSDEPKEIPYKTYYWTDFGSPYTLLKEVKPDKIVFFGLDSNYPMALNIAAKNAGIPTYHLEHGLRGTLQSALEAENKISIATYKDMEKGFTSPSEKKWHSIFYLLRSLRIRNIPYLISIAKLVYFRYKMKASHAHTKVPFDLRNANYYIAHSYKESAYYRERDLLLDEQIIPIGNPFYDHYFNESEDNVYLEYENYFILIDTPYWDGIRSERFNLNYTDRDIFYNKLLQFAKKKGCKLLIKLHPHHYELDNLPEDSDLIFLRQYDKLDTLLKKAEGVFGFYSTLIIPCIYFNDVILFEVGTQFFQENVRKLEVATVLDLRTFEVDDLEFSTKENVHLFVEEYLYKADGKATERLKNILDS